MTTPQPRTAGRRSARLIGGGAATLAICAALGFGGMQLASASDTATQSSVPAGKAPASAATQGATAEQRDQEWTAWADCMRGAGVADFPTQAQLRALEPPVKVRELWTRLKAEPGYDRASQACVHLPGAPKGDAGGPGLG